MELFLTNLSLLYQLLLVFLCYRSSDNQYCFLSHYFYFHYLKRRRISAFDYSDRFRLWEWKTRPVLSQHIRWLSPYTIVCPLELHHCEPQWIQHSTWMFEILNKYLFLPTIQKNNFFLFFQMVPFVILLFSGVIFTIGS